MIVFLTYLRSIFASAFLILYTLFCSVFVIIWGALGSQRRATDLVRIWAGALLWIHGIRIEVEGEENLPESGGGIAVFNHQSHFDIPVICWATSRMIRFGAKIELFKIPFFGAAMRAVGTLPIARENRSEVLKIYREAEQRLNQGIIFVLAPEGTRQSQPRIGRFKKGPFVFAVNAGAPLLPVVIKGAYEVLPKDRLVVNIGRWRRTIRVQFLAPIQTGEWKERPLDDLVQDVREQMVKAYESIPKSV